MADEILLSAVLSDFARTLGTDFPIQRILDHVVERIVGVVPVTAAGVSLITEELAPRYVAASSEDALRFERLQTDLKEGPCVRAYVTGEAVAVADLSTDDRFPRFAPAALESGLRAVFTFPLRHGNGRLGALDLYRGEPGALGERDMAAAQTLADVTAAYLLHAQARDDVAAVAAVADRFRHAAAHDHLTGLPNRSLLQQRVEDAARRSRRSRNIAAILFVDLDRFKRVNDMHGHQVGDQLLQAVSRRLSGLVRPGDTLARYSGDEFVFLCEDLQSESDVDLLARRAADAFTVPFTVAGFEIRITASIGVAYASDSYRISDHLIVEADTAMYEAKRKGGAVHQIIDVRQASLVHERNSLESDLQSAFAHGRLTVDYQPIVRIADGHMTGVEALLRWTHQDRGIVPATTAIAVAERTGLIHEIGAWVLERSCEDHARWRAQYPDTPLDIAVNVSTLQLMRSTFLATVDAILARTRMDPSALVLEVTENVLIDDSDRALKVLSGLKIGGVRIALDDFGTGFSSLSYLRQLPIDIVKIDRAFVNDISDARAGHAIVDAVTHLAHVLGLSVTAEGVETVAQRDDIRAIGCESAQGFFFATPTSADTIAEILAGGSTLPEE